MDDAAGGEMEPEVRAFFERYETLFNEALRSETTAHSLTSLYAEMFIAAHPHGVDGGTNGPDFVETMEEGFQYYRVIGTRGMTAARVDVTPIDDRHAMARVHWRADYVRPSDARPLSIEFDVTYLLQKQRDWRVFAYISGDEEDACREAGLDSQR